MTPTQLPFDEAQRVETLRQYAILDTPPEQALDDLTAMAAQICNVPTALISLVDEQRQWFKSRVGFESPETPRSLSFCAHALQQSEPLIVRDATRDARFASNSLVTGEPHIRFYAGAPLISPEDRTLGTLCVIDRVPRVLTPAQKQALTILARQVMTHLELRRSIRELRLSEERFSNAFRYAVIGMALVSIEGRWMKVNRALCNLLGYSARELGTKTFQDITHPDDLEIDLQNVRDLLEGKTQSYQMEKRYFHKKGYLVWVQLGVSLARDKQNQPLYFISQIQDITESKEAMARQKELTRKAQSAERAKSEFLAIMSHEIRTPLNGVIGMTNVLADTELNDMQRDCVSTISTSGESLLAVINDILDYSKIEAGRLEMENRPFNLQQCVEEALDLFATQIRFKGLEAVYLIAPEIPSILVGDSMRLRQVLVNIIGNAIKFTTKGEVTIIVECKKKDPDGCELLFSVADTGIGIARNGVDKLFHAFQQVDTSTTRRYGGTGLGLVISKRLTEFMGGTMWAESEKGVGSTFFFTAAFKLPLGSKAGDAPAQSELLKAHSILVVEANVTNQRMLGSQLANWGMTAHFAAAGETALELLERGAFEVVLIDSQMDAVALAQKIRARWRTPLILLSSSGEPMAEKEAGLFQAEVLKPIKYSHLLNTLLRVMGIEREHSRKTAEKKWDSGLAARHPLRILLAEDNSVNQKVGLTMLSRLGYTADLAVNGKEAALALEKAAYDLILMDIQMPEMNGIEAAKLIREKLGKDSPAIVALTAEALEGDRQRFLGLGFTEYLSKPLQAQSLQEILKKIARAPAKPRRS